MNKPNLQGSDQAGRKSARLAIAELFLDTELDEEDFIRLSRILKQSKLSIDDLDAIYYDEIAPLLYGNLDSTAGVWEGFDADWLEAELIRHNQARFITKIPGMNRWYRLWVTRTSKDDWLKLKSLLEENK